MADLVGRLDAQLVLRGRLKACTDGRRGVVLVSGASGLGTSRLLAEERRYAERLGLHVLAGRAEAGVLGRPFVALRSALEASLRAEQDPTLRRLAAEVDQQLRVPSAGGRSSLARSVTRLLGAWARRTPLVLVIDDLQAVDRDSCDLLGQLLRQLAQHPLLVVASLHPPLPAHADALVRTWERQLGPDVVRVELGPLDRHDSLALARALVPAPIDPGRLDEVVRSARGNPLLLEEGVAALQAEQPSELAHGTDSTSALILRRLHRVHQEAVAVGSVLALFERPRLDQVPLIARSAGVEEAAASLALDALVSDGTLVVEDGSYRFVLPVARRVLVEDLGPSLRWQLHRTIGEDLLVRRAAGEHVDPVELATHLAAGAVPGDEAALAALLEVAAGFAHHAPQSAADWYGAALALLAVEDPRRPQVLADRARVLYLAGRLEEAVVDGSAALASPAALEAVARTGTIVTAAQLSLGRIRDAVHLAERLLAVDPTLVRVRVQLAAGMNYLNGFAACRQHLERVLEETVDPATTALALGVQAQLALSNGSNAELLAALDAAYAVPGLAEGARLSALTNDATHSVLACELTRATAALAQARALADSLGAVAFDADLELTELMLRWRTGRWEDLQQRIARCISELRGRGQGINLAMLAAMRLELLVAAGELGQAAAVNGELGSSDAVGYSFAAWAQAGYRAARGEAAQARELVAAAWEHDAAVGRVSSAPLLLSRLAETAATRAEAVAAAGTLTELVARHGLARCQTFALRAEGVAHQDVELLREAARAAEADAMPVEAALARLAAGRLSGAPDQDLLPALLVFAEVGAEGWRRQAAALLRAQGVTVPRTRRPRAGTLLTDSELRLAKLVQDGLSNKQIASALALSPKTVEVYLSRVFTKTGVRSRVELAVALSEGRLPQE